MVPETAAENTRLFILYPKFWFRLFPSASNSFWNYGFHEKISKGKINYLVSILTNNCNCISSISCIRSKHHLWHRLEIYFWIFEFLFLCFFLYENLVKNIFWKYIFERKSGFSSTLFGHFFLPFSLKEAEGDSVIWVT